MSRTAFCAALLLASLPAFAADAPSGDAANLVEHGRYLVETNDSEAMRRWNSREARSEK